MKKTLLTALLFLSLYWASVPVPANWVFVDPDITRPPMLARDQLWPEADHTMPDQKHPKAHPNYTAAQIDLVYDYLESVYAKHLPSHQRSYYSKGFRVRYYPTNDTYIYVQNGKVLFESSISQFQRKTVDYWLGYAKADGWIVPTNPDIPNTSHRSHPSHQVEQVEALFDWFEDTYPEYFSSEQTSYYSPSYRFRYYPYALAYLYVSNGQVKFSKDFEGLGDFTIEYWLKFSGISGKATEPKIDLLFDWMEKNYSYYFMSHEESYYKDGYWTRHYALSNSYLYVKDGNVHFSHHGGYERLETFSLAFWYELSGTAAAIADPTPDQRSSVPPDTEDTSRPSHPNHNLSEMDALFDWFEETYPDYFPPHRKSYYYSGSLIRYYPETAGFIFVTEADNEVHFSNHYKGMAGYSLEHWMASMNSDSLFDWMEVRYPDYFPSHQESYDKEGSIERYYPSTNSYMTVTDGEVHFSSDHVLRAGAPLEDWPGFARGASLEFWLGFAGIVEQEPERSKADRQESDRLETARLEAKAEEDARTESPRLKAARLEYERKRIERLEADRKEAERIEGDKTQSEADAEAAEDARLAAKAEEDARLEAGRVEAERVEAERVEAERVEAERVEAERVEAERVEAERVEAERVEAERVEAERVEAERVEAERVEAERVAQHPSYTVEQIDLLLDWMEQSYPGHIPTHQESYYDGVYRTRHYPSNNGYLFVKDSRLYFHSHNLNQVSFSLSYLFELSGITTKD